MKGTKMKLSDKWKKILTVVISAFLGGLGVEIGTQTKQPESEPPAAIETTQPAPVIEQPQPQPETPAPQIEEPDEVNFSELDFCWGSFNGAKAKLGNGRIAALKIGGNLAYKTTESWYKELDCSSKTDANALACLFCKIGGKWQGGKFDWISESRTTRSFENISGGYNGWKKDAIQAATEYAFVIISKNGKTRTNVITVAK